MIFSDAGMSMVEFSIIRLLILKSSRAGAMVSTKALDSTSIKNSILRGATTSSTGASCGRALTEEQGVRTGSGFSYVRKFS